MGVLFASTLWIIFSTMLWTSDSVNEQARERQQHQVAALLSDVMGGLRAELHMTATSPVAAADALGAEPRSHVARSATDIVFSVEPPAGRIEQIAGVPVAGSELARLRPALMAAAEAVLQEGVAAPDPMWGIPTEPTMATGAARFAAWDGRLMALAAEPLANAPRALVGLRQIDERSLADAAARSGLDLLRVAQEQPGAGSDARAFPGLDGRAGLYVAWSSERPGDLVRARLVPLTLSGFLVALVLFGLVAAYLRWISRDLAASQARSRDLLGRDPLSGLANRMLFAERLDLDLARIARGSTGIAVLFIDLDRFKDVNDTFGHRAGDDLIQLVAQRLQGLVRVADTLARLGGDEFAIIQTNVAGQRDAEMLAQRILDALTRPFELGDSQVTIGTSIGVALAPLHADDRETLMRLADTALYQAKNEGRNRTSFFQSRMDETIRMRKVVEEDLKLAISRDELLLHYQPLFSADGERIVALEALVRWPHPTRGLISPADFIPIAEERGLVVPLGRWVLKQACLDGNRWPGLRIAINVSPVQFRHRDFLDGVLRLLDETGFDPSRLELELTEGVVVDDADAAQSVMMQLRGLGVHLALDDFGTGYSSLIYLRRFAFDTIKIDRSFLESMDATGESAILVHSMVHLGRALGLTVTAEGVETPEQHRFLQALGCHQLQGYLFSKPVPAADIDRMLSQSGQLAA